MAAVGSDPKRNGFDELYARHRDAVYRWSLQFGGRRSAFAQDVTQDVFVRLYEKLPELADHHDLGGWLYRVTANLCKTRLKREQSWLGRLSRAFRAEQPDAAWPPSHEAQDEAQAALATVATLPARERVAFCMKVLDGKSQREVARELGVSEALVSRWLTNAWRRIREAGWEAEHE